MVKLDFSDLNRPPFKTTIMKSYGLASKSYSLKSGRLSVVVISAYKKNFPHSNKGKKSMSLNCLRAFVTAPTDRNHT